MEHGPECIPFHGHSLDLTVCVSLEFNTPLFEVYQSVFVFIKKQVEPAVVIQPGGPIVLEGPCSVDGVLIIFFRKKDIIHTGGKGRYTVFCYLPLTHKAYLFYACVSGLQCRQSARHPTADYQ